MELGWQDRFAKLQELAPDASLHMRRPGDWYVSMPRVEIKMGGILASCGESGATPEEAVNRTFERLTTLPAAQVIVVNAGRETRKHYRWQFHAWMQEAQQLYARRGLNPWRLKGFWS